MRAADSAVPDPRLASRRQLPFVIVETDRSSTRDDVRGEGAGCAGERGPGPAGSCRRRGGGPSALPGRDGRPGLQLRAQSVRQPEDGRIYKN